MPRSTGWNRWSGPVPRVQCSGCGHPVNTKQAGVAELVRGWRVNRAGGGANQIVLPKGLGKWRCVACLAVARGADLKQGELW